MTRVLVGILVAMLVAACGGDSESDGITAAPTDRLVTASATTPPVTESSPTVTQTVTPEPTPEPTSVASTRTADQVVMELAEAGLPVGEMRVWTAEDDPNELLGRPNRYTSKTTFHDTRLERPADEWDVDYGGDVEVFETESDAEARETYIKGIIEALPIVTQWVYRHDTVLLRLSHSLTPDQAAEYEVILMEMEI